MTSQEIQRALRKIGLRPQAAAGQNFLLDETVVERMIQAADIQAGDKVLEIGPGLGILTEGLLQAGAEVVAVELDQRLAEYARQKFADFPGFQLVHGDIFKVRLPDIFEDGDYKLVANLPYSSTSLIFRNFLTLPPRPSSLTVMVQRDVAERIAAAPGALSILAVMVQYYGHVNIVCEVPAESFYPTPRIESSVLQVDQLQPVRPTDKKLFHVIRAGFSARRKQVQNSLAGTLHRPTPEVAAALASIGVEPTIRAQEIPVGTWPKISQVLG